MPRKTVKYSCIDCKKVFSQKSHYDSHKKRKIPCVMKDTSLDEYVENKIKKMIEEKLNIVQKLSIEKNENENNNTALLDSENNNNNNNESNNMADNNELDNIPNNKILNKSDKDKQKIKSEKESKKESKIKTIKK